jgi:hypothetical protein
MGLKLEVFETCKMMWLPSFLLAKERVDQRSAVGVSQPADITAMHVGNSLLTPDSLRSPALSSTSGKEGNCNYFEKFRIPIISNSSL